MHIYILIYTSIYIYRYQEGAYTARICFTSVSVARHGIARAKNPHCTDLLVRICTNNAKWIPNFTNLHGTAWKVPVHMDPNLSLFMELISYESQFPTAYGDRSRHCQITGHGFHGTTLPMASIEPHRTDLHRRSLARSCTDLPEFDDAGFEWKTSKKIRKFLEFNRFHAAAFSFSRGCTALHGNFFI